MKQLLFFIALIFLAAASVVAQRMDSLINAWKKEFAGKDIAVGIYRNGRSSFYLIGKNSDPNSLFDIGSITKTFTGFLLARAVVDNKINLSDDIRKYVDGAYPHLEKNGEQIRVVHLANTTSGLPNNLVSSHIDKELHAVRLDTTPGTKSAHSNAASQVLGNILQRAYGSPLDSLLRRYITVPLGMTNTRVSAQFAKKGLAAGAGIQASAKDLLRFASYLMSDTTSMVPLLVKRRAVTVDAMTNQVVALDTSGAPNPGIYHWGLGWLIYRPQAGQTQLWADGNTDDYSSYVALYPEQHLAIVILARDGSEKMFRALPKMVGKLKEIK